MNETTCAQQHFGPWAIDSAWMANAVSAIRNGTWSARTPQAADPSAKGYQVSSGGVAVIGITDQITKHQSSFGGTSTVATRQAIRKAVADPNVTGIMLHIDSPGGTVSGTADLAYEVRRATASKPVHAYVEDMGASAAYWIASQASRISANETAMVGSIGVYTVLEDTTGAMDKAGVKLRVVSSGGVKGLGADGAVTQPLIDDTQREIDQLNERFLSAVADGRGLTDSQVRAWNDGRVHVGSTAKDIGMIDAVETFDAALAALTKETNMNAQTFNQYAAENKDSAEVLALINQGVKAGKADGLADARSELKALAEAIPGRPEFVLQQFIKGNDVVSAKAELSDVLAGELEEAKKVKPVAAAPQGQGAIPLAQPVEPAATAKPEGLSPKAQAEWEWDNQKPEGFSSKENFVAYREADLNGAHRTFTRKTSNA